VEEGEPEVEQTENPKLPAPFPHVLKRKVKKNLRKMRN